MASANDTSPSATAETSSARESMIHARPPQSRRGPEHESRSAFDLFSINRARARRRICMICCRVRRPVKAFGTHSQTRHTRNRYYGGGQSVCKLDANHRLWPLAPAVSRRPPCVVSGADDHDGSTTHRSHRDRQGRPVAGSFKSFDVDPNTRALLLDIRLDDDGGGVACPPPDPLCLSHARPGLQRRARRLSFAERCSTTSRT